MSLEGTSALVSDRYLISAVVDSGQTVTPGQVVYISTGGFVPAVTPTAGLNKSVIGVALTGGSAGQTITVICRGLVRVATSSTNGGVVSAGQRLASDANGAVQGLAAMTAPPVETGANAGQYDSNVVSELQAQLDKTEQWIGRALTASSAAGTVIYALIYCIP